MGSTFFSNIVKLISRYGHVFLLEGVFYTLLLSLIAVAGGAVLGSLFAFAKRSKLWPLRALVSAIVEIVRGTPMLLQLYAGVFLFPRIITVLKDLPDIVSVIIVLIINSGAYVSEVIRSGIQAVDIGQTEAARSLGLTERTTMLSVVLPQAIKNILPAIANEFVTIIKESAICYTIGVQDIMSAVNAVKGSTYRMGEALIIATALYFCLTFPTSKIIAHFERRMRRGDLR